MSEPIGSPANPLRVAIFGSGPAGFYACEELLKQDAPTVHVDMYDRLPTPYGLVRGGVAPDHQKIKSVIRLYERTANRPGYRFFGNVSFGDNLSLDEVLGHYHMALFSTGAESDRKMGIPGEDLPGSHPATIFVGWYNGHPDYRHLEFDLGVESVAVIGNGNVAMDVVRILARPVEELAKTDIADYALEALRHSKVKTIYLLGRRGPAQGAFTNPEIRELTEIPGVDLALREEDLTLDEVNREFLEGQKDPVHQRNMDVLTAHLAKGEGSNPRKICAWFFTSPAEVLGTDRVAGLKLERNRLVKSESGRLSAKGTGEFSQIDVGLVFRSIGYHGTALPDLPFDEWQGTIPNKEGRVVDPKTDSPLGRLYVAGWIKRGPSGVIGTNKPDAIATVKCMLEDIPALQAVDGVNTDPAAVEQLLRSKGVRYVSFEDWKKLDALEIERGQQVGKPREKFTTIDDMLNALG